MNNYDDSRSMRQQMNGAFAASLRREKLEARLYPRKKKGKPIGKKAPPPPPKWSYS